MEGHAGLVVMSTHGRTGTDRAWLGSRANELARHTHLPIFLIPPEHRGAGTPSEVRHLLVALDGSLFGEQILEPAMDLVVATGARVTLVNVITTHVTVGTRSYPLAAGGVEVRRRRAEDLLERTATRVRAEVEDVQPHVMTHVSPAQGILAAAEDVGADCVALASHGYGGLRRMVLGSVADGVLRSSERPILLKRTF